MLALKIIGVIVLIFFIVGRIRAGVDFSIIDDRVRLAVKICGISLQLIPRKSKKEKPEKEKTEKPPEEKPKKAVKEKKPKKDKKPFFKVDIYDVREMLSKVAAGIRRFNSGFNLEKFVFHFTASSWDPYVTARIFSYVNAGLSVLVPVIDEKNRCRELDVRTDIDFNELFPKTDFGICITFRIGAAFGMVFKIVFGVLWVFIKIVFRFLWMKLFDKEEYDFRMNQQEGPIKFFRRVISENRKLRDEQKQNINI